MTSAAAPLLPPLPTRAAATAQDRENGAQRLLEFAPQNQHYPAQVAAAVVYALFLAGVVTLTFRHNEAPVEEIAAIELAPIPAETLDQPDPQPEVEQPEVPDTPLPLALDPIAPVEEVKPQIKPTPKPVRKVERTAPHAPVAAKPAQAARGPAVPAVRAPAAPPGAATSAIANSFHACMQRAASNGYPESQAPRTARISYHATFNATGSLLSYSISPSGNAAFDAVANRLGGRCGSVPAPGRPVSLSGALTFSP